ncbi:MAG: alkaline phosphatase family protein [Prolixibacteraceae bacterium]|nr:alkaline phosphatase family protein [Prolixibacteraceae bacterium]
MMFCKITFISILFFLLANVGSAQRNAFENRNAPLIVVGITIEQLRPDYITRYWDSFQQGGFKRLINEGAFTLSARLDIHNINSSSVAASVYTGTYPAEHGIVANKWYRQLTGEYIHSYKNDYYLTLGSDSKVGNASANMLKAYTVGDALKQNSNFNSKVFSVSLTPGPAIFSAGHAADGAYWYDITSGNMISSSYYIDAFPDWIRLFNDKKIPDTYLEREWDLLLPKGSYKNKFNDDYILEKGYWNKWNTFPYSLPKLSTMAGSKYEVMCITPWGNRLIRDFAVQLIEREGLGNDEMPDLMAINFTSLGFANKWFGPVSTEMHDHYLRIDQDIASLLNYLDKKMGKDNYLVFLTASSTCDYGIEFMKEEMNFNAGEFSPQSAMALLKAYLHALYGPGEWLVGYNEEQVYLNHNLIDAKSKSLDEMQDKAALFLNQFEGIKAALPAHVIEKGNLDNPRFYAIENSYCVQRSGDIMLLLEEGWQPSYKYNEVDYSTYNQAPVIFFGSVVRPGEIVEPVEITDIAPTISRFLKILPPDNTRGKIIQSVFW